MSDKKKLRGAAATPGNRESYFAEIAKLEASGEKFKANQHGKVSVGNFAKKVGCGRDVLKTGALAEYFWPDVDKIGVEVKPAPNAKRQEENKKKKKEASKARAEVNVLLTKNKQLEKDIEDLKNENHLLRMSEEEGARSHLELLKTGRRFNLWPGRPT